jgi:hypothetical protein
MPQARGLPPARKAGSLRTEDVEYSRVVQRTAPGAPVPGKSVTDSPVTHGTRHSVPDGADGVKHTHFPWRSPLVS